MTAKTDLSRLLDALLGGDHVAILNESLALAAVLLAAWWAGLAFERRLSRSPSAWRFVGEGLARVAFPLTALALAELAAPLLARRQAVVLLDLAAKLLLAMAATRLLAYMLRQVAGPRAGAMTVFERLIAAVVWSLVALHMTGLLPGALGALDAVGFHAGRQYVSLLAALQGAVSLAICLVVVLWISALVENRLMLSDALTPNLRVVVAKLARAALLLAGILTALSLAGIDLTVLSVFGGALGVGLGFGLQKIASNYVSGFIILLDRSIHLDDEVTVDNRRGRIARLTARHTVVRALDGTDVIIPNETLVTSTVLNHTQAKSRLQVGLPLRLRPGADLDAARAALLEAAAAHPRVSPETPPIVLVRNIAANGIEVELVATLLDLDDNQALVKSEIYHAAWRLLRAGGVRLG